MSDTANSAHPESEERLRALIDAFGVAAEQYGYSRKAYPRSAAAIHAENQRAESRRVLLDELARLRASLVEANERADKLQAMWIDAMSDTTEPTLASLHTDTP